MNAQPRRRASDRFAPEPDTPVVVTLKDYVDVQVEASDKRVAAIEEQSSNAVNGLRGELATFKTEIRGSLAALATQVGAIRETDAGQAGALSALQKLGVFVVGFVAVLVPIATLVLTATAHK